MSGKTHHGGGNITSTVFRAPELTAKQENMLGPTELMLILLFVAMVAMTIAVAVCCQKSKRSSQASTYTVYTAAPTSERVCEVRYVAILAVFFQGSKKTSRAN